MKRILISTLTIAALCFAAIYFAFQADEPGFDLVAVHFATQEAAAKTDAQEAAIGLSSFLTSLVEEANAAREQRDAALMVLLYAIIAAFIFIFLGIYFYVRIKILKPFDKLKSFAQRVARGDLDVPLEMDKGNLFGAFTESFDIMREELRTARENEIAIDKSKKELVASLTHDINTPVASVRSALDVLRLKLGDDEQLKLIDSANAKLEQIDSLVTNLFQSTLEELQELKVMPSEVQSTDVYNIIKQADYEGRCGHFFMTDCIVNADLFRLQQVFDNIIKNSYKYAATDIAVSSFIDEDSLFIEIKDFGAGVDEKELPLLTGKFYRGSNATKASGHGLGLFLSKSFLERMDGSLHLENHEDGFVVVVTLKLAQVL